MESLDFSKAILAHAKCSSNEAEEIASASDVFNGHDSLIEESRRW
ncbi:hypothetical protein [Wolbachia endosymbiont of Wuchereria bancrofti]|nr:hypothetical protein [Wolbachia endosymbiont of Wuchereria bancrofti]